MTQLFNIDQWARRKGYLIQNPTSVKQIDRALELGKKIGLILGRNVKVTDISEGFEIMFEGDVWELEAQDLINGLETYGAYVYIGDQLLPEKATSTILRHKCCAVFPRQMYLGVSCPLNYPTEDLLTGAAYFLKQKRIAPKGVRSIAAYQEKKYHEAIWDLAYDMDITVERFSREEIMAVLDKTDFKRSNDNREGEDLPAIAAPVAFLAAKEGVLINDRVPVKEAHFALAQKLEIISMAL